MVYLHRAVLGDRVGTRPANIKVQDQAITSSQLEEFGKALLGLTGLDDLTDWLREP